MDEYATAHTFPPGEYRQWAELEGDLACGVRPDGTAACFDAAEPAKTGLPAAPLTGWEFAYDHACGLDAGGVARCGTLDPKEHLAWAPPTEPLRELALAELGLPACGIAAADGALRCVAGREPLTPPAGAFRTVSCARTGCCAVAESGSLACFGSSEHLTGPLPAGHFLDVATDGSSACAVRDDGALSCWGSSTDTPREVPAGPFVSVDHGFVAARPDGSVATLYASWYCHHRHDLPPVRWADRTIAVGLDGRPFAFGGDALGPIPTGPMVDVDGGVASMCAVGRDTRVTCFGDEAWVVQHAPTDAGYVEVAVGNFSACARRADGSTRCWGRPDWVRDEDGAFLSLLPGGPSREPGPEAKGFDGAVTGLVHGQPACAKTTTGGVCRDVRGEFPLPPGPLAGRRMDACVVRGGEVVCGALRAVSAGEASPVLDLPDVVGVAFGYEHGCAWNATTAACWGRDTSGETQPPPGAFASIVAAEKRTCGLRPTGEVACWGGSAKPPAGHFTAVAITQETDLRMHTFACGIRAEDATLQCWVFGEN